MSDPERPRVFGSKEDRALLERMAAAPVVVPEALRLRTRRAVEERLARGFRPPWHLGLSLAATVLLASALAHGLAVRRRSALPAPGPPPAVPRGAPPPARREAVAPPVELARPPRSPPRTRRIAAREPLPVRNEGVLLWPLPEDDERIPAPAPPPPRLVIAREGQRPVSLVLQGNRVTGDVRGTPVDLTVDGSRLLGTLGQRNVWLWLHGDRAEGEIGGVPVRAELLETRTGHQLRQGFSVRSYLPFGATRLETSGPELTWSGCGAPLTQVSPGVYAGRCASGRAVRVELPPAWQDLPRLAGFMVLSFFLTERDPAMARLFRP